MTQKSRSELKQLFRTGAKPSQQDFADFIESTLNVKDDGIEKPSGANTPLKITAQDTDEKLLDFYAGETKTWSINQKPGGNKNGLNISHSGGSKLFIDSSNGNVGIGTSDPGSYKLTVEGNQHIKGTLTITNSLSVAASAGSTTNIDLSGHVQLKEYGTQNLAYFQARDDSSNRDIGLRIRTQKKGDSKPSIVEAITINSEGNVGIGTSTPSTKLEVSGDLKVTGAITPSAGNSENNGIMFPKDPGGGSGDAAWIRYYSRNPNSTDLAAREQTTFEIGTSNDATDHIALMSGKGNVGIGTTNPSAKLEVNGDLKVNSNITGSIDAVNINSGILSVGRIPNLSANKITSGILSVERIPNLSADKITSGTISGNLAILNLEVNGNLKVQDVIQAPKGILIEGQTDEHINRDGAFYRHNGQVYLTVDDNFYIRDSQSPNSTVRFETNSGNLTLSGSLSIGDLKVTGNLVGAAKGPLGEAYRIAMGRTTMNKTNWIKYDDVADSIYVNVNTSGAKFSSTPYYFAILGGSNHWLAQGVSSIYDQSSNGFKIYVRDTEEKITAEKANQLGWHIQWIGIGT